MIRNQTGQVAAAQVNNASTGAAFVGTVTVYVDGDNGGQAIGSVGSGLCTAAGNGLFTYLPSQAETNYKSVSFTFVGPGAIAATTTYDTITEAQQVAIQDSTVANAIPILTLLNDAASEFGLLDAVQTLAAADQQFMLRKLNRIFDSWNADPYAANVDVYTQYVISPSVNPQTIGPTSAIWTVTARPDDILAATIFLSGTSPVIRFPLVKRDQTWWTRNTVQALPSSLPVDFYYQPTWPNGSLFLWPLCSAALTIELVTRNLFQTQSLAATLGLPFGYQDALTYTLAEECAGAFNKVVSPKLEQLARTARARVFGAHRSAPRLITRDAGMPSSGGSGSHGTYLTGWQGR